MRDQVAHKVALRWVQSKQQLDYKKYVDDKRKKGEKPLPKDEWESKVLGKGKEKPDKGKAPGSAGKWESMTKKELPFDRRDPDKKLRFQVPFGMRDPAKGLERSVNEALRASKGKKPKIDFKKLKNQVEEVEDRIQSWKAHGDEKKWKKEMQDFVSGAKAVIKDLKKQHGGFMSRLFKRGEDEALRQALIKIANEHPKFRPHIVALLQKHAVSRPRRQDVELQLRTGPETVSMVVSGNWGVHKSVTGRGWALTHIPTSLLAMPSKTQKAALGALQAISTMPDLLNARTQSDIMKHRDFLLKLREGVTGKKLPLNIEAILESEGLANQGSRYGKAGEFWGLSGNSRMIAVGRRDILRNVFFVGIRRPDQVRRPDTRWLMAEGEYQSKMTEDRLRKWAQWAKKGISTTKLRDIARKEYDRKGSYVGIDGGQYSR